MTTGAVSGTVLDSAGAGVAGVQIRIVNKSTGFATGTLTRDDGRYLVQGLEVGGPYEVTARRIGYQPQTRDGQRIALSQNLRLDFVLAQQVTELAGVSVTAAAPNAEFSPSNTGTKTVVSDTTIQRMPTLNRNLTDFIRLTPQVSSSGPGYSGGGMSNRMNNVQIDGATERDVFGLGSTGQPGAEVNSRSVSIEAVKEFQVLLAPFDVRQGNFGGLLLNAVTKGGTNELHGSAFYFYRNEKFGANEPALRSTPFDRTQYGFSLGGPIVRDKLHFFIAPEFQRENTPVTGPYAGQPATQSPAFALNDADRQRFENAMASLGETRLGTAGYTNIPNPLANFFGRVDWSLSPSTRMVFRYNYSKGERLRQQNPRRAADVVYSSNFHDMTNAKNAPVLQLFTNFQNGSSNELFLGYNRVRQRRVPLSSFPQITVNSVTGPNGTARIIAGADQFSQTNELDTDTYELTDNFTLPVGAHTLTFGTRNEYVKLRNQFNQSSYGVWQFANLDALEARNPSLFRRAIILRDNGNVYFSALQSALYAQDQWQATSRLTLTLGARVDVSKFLEDVPYNAPIDSAYHRSTSDIPKSSVQFSPRFGFNWDVTGDQVNQIRGGAGLFVGTPPYVWLENAYVNSGNIITFLNCSGADPAPAFQVDPSGIETCANGKGSKPIGDVNFLDKNLKFPQPMRVVLGYDRQLPWNLVASVEGLYSRTLNQLFFVNRNLAGVRGVDQYGRLLYADTILASNGQARPVLPADVIANGGRARFSTAIDLLNQSKDYSYNVTVSLRKRYSHNWEGSVAYTYGKSQDVQSFTSSTHISNWQFGRTLAGDQLVPTLGRSLFDQRHKIVASGTYTLNWMKRFSTDFSLFYQGRSGAPHDYIYAAGASGSGDLNGDGVSGNDLVYVPKSVNAPSEIRFADIKDKGGAVLVTAADQAAAFDTFINNSKCLSKYRGSILQRNACTQPFSHQFDVAIRQNLGTVGLHRMSVQLDVFNVGNLLNKNWGQVRTTEASGNSNVPLLTHVGMSSDDPKTATPIFTFNTKQREYVVQNVDTNFWRTQLSFRYSF